MKNLSYCFACLVICCASPLLAQSPSALPPSLPLVNAKFSGVLNYIDYRSNKPVSIPMQFSLATSADKAKLIVDRVYTDPGYQVFSLSVMRYQQAQAKWIDESFEGNEHNTTVYDIISFKVTSDRHWRLERTALSEDDNRAAKLTLIESMQGDLFHSETRVDYLDTEYDENLKRNWVSAKRISE